MLFKRIVFAIAFLGLACPFRWDAWAVHEVSRLKVVPEESRIEFVASYSFISHHLNIVGEIEGRLSVRSGEVKANPSDPAKGTSGVMVIDPHSLDTGNRWRDEQLRKTYFEEDKFPAIWFSLTKVRGSRASQDLGQESERTLEGRLTLHGVTQKVLTKARVARKDRRIVVDGETVVPMSRYGMKLPKSPPFLTGRDDVRVKFHIVLEGPPEK